MTITSITPTRTDTTRSEAGMLAFLASVDPLAADVYERGSYGGLSAYLTKEQKR